MLRLALALLVFAVGFCGASASAAAVDYERDIKPLLAKKCSACHGVLKQESDLRLDVGRLIFESEDPVIVPGQPDESRLLERVAADDVHERMPPEGEGEALTAEQLDLVRRWIAAGARVPADEPIPPRPEEHWAFVPPQRSEVPDTGLAGESINPIDAFLGQKYAEAGLAAVPPADPATLLRRVWLDLVGLPPAPEEVQEFVGDDSDAAYEAIVDRLLESPQHGERWARHWMDVWRYSDWDGYKNQLRGSQRHVWRWRDWIVESLNTDTGYDDMIVAMLAGDELAPEDPDTLRATGYLARSYHNSNRDIWLDATVEHTAKAFLGLTINCARCHDHKYDPLAQQEYYAMRAIFEPHHVRTDRLPGEANTMNAGLTRVYDAKPEQPTYLYIRGNEKHPDKENPVDPGVPAIFGEPLDVAPVELPVEAYVPALRDFIEREDVAAAEGRLTQAQAHLKKVAGSAGASKTDATPDEVGPPAPALPQVIPLERQIAEAKLKAAQENLASLKSRWAADKAKHLAGEAKDDLARQAASAERRSKQAQAQLTSLEKLAAVDKLLTATGEEKAKPDQIAKAREEFTKANDELAKATNALAVTDAKYTPVGETYASTSTGRRLALAKWIARRDNPLTARVAVNHVWLRHFGEPLVENVFDFGLRSPRPLHADLLDWLAVELMENDWSLKHLHRLIVSSRTYRLASSSDSASTQVNREIDPDNRYFWRANIQRLDAEVIRDSLLKIAGRLDPTVGGPELDFTKGQEIPRRSLYFRHAYEKQMRMLVLFDAASPNECYRRSESVIPQQALALANSDLSIGCARQLAATLSAAHDGKAAFVEAAFEHVLGRSPTIEERATCQTFLDSQSTRLANPETLTAVVAGEAASRAPAESPDQRARENLVHVLMNHNDFVTVR